MFPLKDLLAARLLAAVLTGAAVTVAAALNSAGATEALAAVPPEVIAFNAHLVETTSRAAGIFKADVAGSVRHLASGLVCPALFPDFHLMDLQVFGKNADAANDVGCDYARIGNGNTIASKLTVFFVKAPPNASIDEVFSRYRAEVTTAHPAAIPMKAALQIGQRTDYRAMGYTLDENGRRSHSELIVGLINGWIVEVRATYANSVILAGPNTTKADLAGQLHDIQNTYIAYMSVMGLQ